jgi:hypothetical protein
MDAAIAVVDAGLLVVAGPEGVDRLRAVVTGVRRGDREIAADYGARRGEGGAGDVPAVSATAELQVTALPCGSGQRSLDAAGGLATQARNQSGFRFAPKGDKLLLINEAGYLRASSPTARCICRVETT